MGKISIDYSLCEDAIRNLKHSMNALEDEIENINKAIRELNNLNNYYREADEILDKLNSQRRKLEYDYDKLGEFRNRLKSYIGNVRYTDERLAKKFKNILNENGIKIRGIESGASKFLDFIQVGLDGLGLIPGIGIVFDGTNTLISLCRGDLLGAGLSLIAMVPLLGYSAPGLKGIRYLDEAKDILKYGDEAVDLSKSFLSNIRKPVSNVGKNKLISLDRIGDYNEFYKSLDSTIDIGNGQFIAKIKGKGEVLIDTVKDNISYKGKQILGEGCFVGNTLVKTESGLKYIKDISISDRVLSKNEDTGIIEYRKVIDTIKKSAREFCILNIGNTKIKSTTGHMFMIKDKWWIPAINIEVGDFIEISEGKYKEVTNKEIEVKTYPEYIYNITVEGNHTFYVGEDEVLTHNTVSKNSCMANIRDAIKGVGNRNALLRGDSALYSDTRPNGIRKSYISSEGNLVPANIDGMYKGRQVTVTEHILGGYRKGAKGNSPYTSFTFNSDIVAGYGDNLIEIDISGLRKAIQSGDVTDVVILSPKQIERLIKNDKIQSDFWKKRALNWTKRDSEYLIRGEIPSQFIKINK